MAHYFSPGAIQSGVAASGAVGHLVVSPQPDRVVSSRYPTNFNHLNRNATSIAGLLDFSDSGNFIVTAHPGYEFQLPRTSVHAGGGSHGSLHLVDFLVPLLVAAVPEGIEPPSQPRTVDIMPLCLSILGLET
jgi:hypothetical protein